MASTRPANRGVSRVLAKLQTSIDCGNFYEAHQMYRTLYFRYLGQQKYDELLDLLYKGSLVLLVHEQYTSGADLALLLVDTLEKSNCEEGEQWMNKIGILISKIPANIVERETLLVKSVKWSSLISKTQVGHPQMHKLIAQVMVQEGNFTQAKHHFLLSKDGDGCGKMLLQLSIAKGYATEVDLFIAQFILQQLCLKETETAMKTFGIYTKYHPKIACTEPPFIQPLLNFLFFLLKAIETKKLIVFKSLCELYKPSLDRDPSYEKYLQKIGILFFGAPQPQRQTGGIGGIFGDLLNQLLEGLDGEEEGGDEARQTGFTGAEDGLD